jgi:signal transduction histidine kinase
MKANGAFPLIVELAALSGWLLFEQRQRKRAEKQRRRTEEEHLQLTGRLINAQEEERNRVARELHDDFSQRLAALAVGLEAMEESVAEPSERSVTRTLSCRQRDW